MVSESMNHNVRVGSWQDFGHVALPLRMAVFVNEQGVPAELEHDDLDETATHAVVLDSDDTAIATGRVLITDTGVAKIGRLAVNKSYRGHGLGKLVLLSLIAHAKQAGATCVKLHAQCPAQQFYERLGFELQGERFMEAGLWHILMVKALDC